MEEHNLEENMHFALLYDFYGELLDERKREILEMRFYDDLSLTEIAQATGITKQAVSDTIRKSQKKLDDFELRLRLLEKFTAIKAKAERIEKLSDKGSEIGTLAKEIVDTM